jgi:hypothetical protein
MEFAYPLSSEWQVLPFQFIIIHDSSTRAFWQSHLVEKQEEHDEQMATEFCVRSMSFIFIWFFNTP